MKRLLIRADANSQIGYGHVMRCLALAQAWRETRGPVTFVMESPSPELCARLQDDGMEVTPLTVEAGSEDDARLTCEEAERTNASWMVLDGYRFQPPYEERLKRARPLLRMDDEARAPQICADIVLNQNVYANAPDYEGRAPGARLLLGCYYCLLRREFQRSGTRQIASSARRILVTLGGSDPDNVTPTVLRELGSAKLKDAEVRVIAGAGNPFLHDIRAQARQAASPVEVLVNVTDMPSQMEWADVAISGAGSTCWEMAYLGLPAIVVVLSRDQKRVAETLEERGIVVNLGWHKDGLPRLSRELQALCGDESRRRRMSQRGQELVDGKGAARVIAEMEALR